MILGRNVVELIGRTPMVRLNRASEATGCEIWGKAEFLNPAQSIKDRAALYIVRDAEKKGLLKPGGLIVEGTAGNTGIGLADPFGAALFNWYTAGELKSEGSSITEGIGQGRVTANLEGLTIDMAYQIPDAEALEQIYDLVEHEGMCLGGSSGVNIAGAIRLARDLGPDKTIVTILADFGQRYQGKMFNPEFLKERGLPTPPWM